MTVWASGWRSYGPARSNCGTNCACYRTLLRLPPLPRRPGSLAHLIEVEAALLEAAADRLEIWANCWPSPPSRRGITARGNSDPRASAGRNLEAAEMGLLEDEDATAVLLSGSGGRRAVACTSLPHRKHIAAAGVGPAEAIAAGGIQFEIDLGAHHRPTLHQRLGQLGVADRGGDVLLGGGQGVHLKHLAHDAAKAAALGPLGNHLHWHAVPQPTGIGRCEPSRSAWSWPS